MHFAGTNILNQAVGQICEFVPQTHFSQHKMSQSHPQTKPKSFKAIAFQVSHEQLDSVKENLAGESSKTNKQCNVVDGSSANNKVETLNVNTHEERTKTEENGKKSIRMPVKNGNLPSEESSVTPTANIRGTERSSSNRTELSD